MKHRRHGVGALRGNTGLFLKKLEGLGEKSLDVVIGTGERLLARSIYLTELVSELQEMARVDEEAGKFASIDSAPETVEELLQMDPDQIPTEAKDYARRMVNDMMGVADQAKKALPFRSLTRNAGLSAFARSAVRFSNHTATTSSNATALIGSAF